LTPIDREQLEEKLGWLRAYRQAIDQWSEWHEVIQVVVRQVRRHEIDRDSIAELQRQFEKLNLSPPGLAAAEAMKAFVADQAWVARLGGELLIGSTEILESIFGDHGCYERDRIRVPDPWLYTRYWARHPIPTGAGGCHLRPV